MGNPDVLIDLLKKNVASFESVVPFNPSKNKLLALDFTNKNKDLVPEIVGNTDSFTEYIRDRLKESSATYGIGGYGEHRTIYSRSSVFDSAEEPRRLHLGIDIWGKPFTKVIAPINGMVHSFKFNSAYGDYGATIILSHHIEEISFYTLYGHLSLASIKNIREGKSVEKGDVIAEFGIPQENGNWPPHLHFQIIKDLQGIRGDYPGVCKFSEKDQYLNNCPDPDLILQMMSFAQ